MKALQQLDGIYQYQAELGKEALGHAKQIMESYDSAQIGGTLKAAIDKLSKASEILKKYKQA